MTHESLVERLIEDLTPVRRRRSHVDVLVLASICAVELALFFAAGVARPHLRMLTAQSSFWWRLGILGAIALLSGAAAIRSLDPANSPGRGARSLALIAAVCVLFVLAVDAPPVRIALIVHRLAWTSGMQCAGKIALLSIPPLIGLGVLARRGAPTDARATALLAGLAAASWGALVFVFACPFDDPLYIAVWYGVGCGLVTLVSRLLLPRLTRW